MSLRSRFARMIPAEDTPEDSTIRWNTDNRHRLQSDGTEITYLPNRQRPPIPHQRSSQESSNDEETTYGRVLYWVVSDDSLEAHTPPSAEMRDAFTHVAPSRHTTSAVYPSPSLEGPSNHQSPRTSPMMATALYHQDQSQSSHMVQDFDYVPKSGGPTQSIAIQDRRRLIGDAVLENPVMFTFNQSTWQPGVPLDPTMLFDYVKHLEGYNEPAFSNHIGNRIEICIQWPGYRPWYHSIAARELGSTTSRRVITVGDLVLRLKRCIEQFTASRMVNRHEIRLGDLVLVGLRNVAPGSWEVLLASRSSRESI